MSQDFMLSVGFRTAPESIRALEQEVKSALEKIPAATIKVKVDSKAAQDLIRDNKQVSDALETNKRKIKETGTAWEEANERGRKAVGKLKGENKELEVVSRDNFRAEGQRNRESIAATNKIADAKQKIIDKQEKLKAKITEVARSEQAMGDMATVLHAKWLHEGQQKLEMNERIIASNHKVDRSNATNIDRGISSGARERSGRSSSPIAPWMAGAAIGNHMIAGDDERAAKSQAEHAINLNKEAEALRNLNDRQDEHIDRLRRQVESHQRLNGIVPDSIRNYNGFMDAIAHDASRFIAWYAGMKLVEGGMHVLSRGFGDSVHSEKEQVIAGQYFQAQGVKYDKPMSDAVQMNAITLAKIYGAEVIHVQENIGLWAKITNGELNPALGATAMALKLASVSGMNMEEIQRSTVAAMAQTNSSLSKQKDLYNAVYGLALKYGGGILSLEGQSQDTVKVILEGVDGMAAVMGKGGMSIEQMAASIATLNHVVNKNGEFLSGHLSAAFAKLETGAARKILHEAGIEMQGNSHIVEDLAKNWAKLGKELEDRKAIRPQDAEVLTALIQRVKLYEQAVKDAKKAEKDNTLEGGFSALNDTTARKIERFHALWQGLAITMGRDNIPAMKGFFDILNTGLQFLIRHTQEVLLLAKGFAVLTAVVLGMSIFKTVFRVVAISLEQGSMAWANFKLMTSSTVESTTMNLAAMDEEFSALNLRIIRALKSSEVSMVEFQDSIRLMAVQSGLSIDQVVLKLAEMSKAAGTTAEIVGISAKGMSGAYATAATAIGIESGAIKMSFDSVATRAKFTALEIQGAFMRMIPVIGAVVIAADGAKMLVDQVKAQSDKRYNKHIHSDPNFVNSEIIEKQHQREGLEREYAAAKKASQLKAPQLAGAPGQGVDLRDGRIYTDYNIEGIEDRLLALKQEQQDLQVAADWHRKGRPKSQDAVAEAEANAAKANKDAQKAYEAMIANSKKPVAGEAGNVRSNYEEAQAKAKKEHGAASAGSKQALENTKIVNLVNQRVKAVEELIKIDNLEIRTTELRMKLHPTEISLMDRLSNQLQKQVKDQKALAAAYEQAYKSEMKQANSLDAKAGKTKRLPSGKQTTESLEYQRQAEALRNSAKENELKRLTALATAKEHEARIELTHNEKLLISNNALIASRAKIVTQIQSDIKNATTANAAHAATEATSKAEAAAIRALAAEYEHQAKIITSNTDAAKQRRDEFNRMAQAERDRATAVDSKQADRENTASTLADEVKEKLTALKIEVWAPHFSALATALRDTLAANKEYTKEKATIDAGTANQVASRTAELDSWRKLRQSIIDTTLATADYDKRKQALESGLGYQIFSKSVDTIGGSVSKSLYDQVSGKNNEEAKIGGLQNQIASLERQKSMLTGTQFEGQRRIIDDTIKRLQENITKQRADLAKPGLFKTIVNDIQKSIIDSTVKKAEDSLKKAVEDVFLGGKAKDSLTQQAEALKQYHEATAGILKPTIEKQVAAIDVMKKADDGFTTDVTRQVDAFTSFGQNVAIMASAIDKMGSSGGGGINGRNPLMAAFENIVGGGDGGGIIAGVNAGSTSGNTSDPLTNIMSVARTNISSPDISGVNTNINGGSKGGILGQLQSAFGIGDPSKFTSKTGSIGKDLGYIGAAYAAYQGYQKGGVQGGLQTGLAVFQATGNPYIAAAAALVAGLHHVDDKDKMPDKYRTTEWGTALSNFLGSGRNGQATWGANGQQFSQDSALQKSLGGMSEAEYITAYIKSHPNNDAGLSKDQLSEFTGLASGAGAITGGKDGNLTLSNGQNVWWETLDKNATDAVSKIKSLGDASAASAKAVIMSINSYGGQFSPNIYRTPGMNGSDLSALMSQPYTTYAALTPSSATSGGSGSGSGGGGGQVVNHNVVVLDGKVLYENVSARARQRSTMGFRQNY